MYPADKFTYHCIVKMLYIYIVKLQVTVYLSTCGEAAAAAAYVAMDDVGINPLATAPYKCATGAPETMFKTTLNNIY